MIAKEIKASIVAANARSAGDTGSPEVQVALLTGRLVGKGSGVEETSLAGLGVPLNNGINLLVGDGDLRGDALEGSLLRSGLVACSKAETDNGEE